MILTLFKNNYAKQSVQKVHFLGLRYFKINKARTGPRSAARFCKILKLCNKFISIHYLRKYKYIGYPSVGDKINP